MHDNPVGSICPSVDISNGISLTYALPMGAENIDAIEGNLRLIQTQEGGHSFVPLGEEENDPTLPMEIAYVDDAGAICRCWNWRDGVRTSTSDTTPHCVFVMECVDPSRSEDLHRAIDELSNLLQDILGADITNKAFITKEHPCCEII